MAFKKIKFVTDSTCDIPDELIRKWGITVVPTFVNVGEDSYADDGVQLDRTDYYNRLPSLTPFPTTAAPSPGLARQKIEEAFKDADHVMIVTAPAKLSAIYEAMRIGSADIPPDQRTLIDSTMVTMGLGFQVLIGAEVAAETGDVAQVEAAMARVRANCKVVALVNSLDNLRRSGRINLASAGIGSLLQIKPIVNVGDSAITVLSRVRTARRAREETVDLLRAQAPMERLALLHANNLEGVAWMREQIADIAPPEILEVNITPTLGTHVGVGSLGFVTVKENWRQ